MPVTLAALDLVPVLLTALGLRVVARLVAHDEPAAGRWAAVGALLVVTGGLGKAGAKVVLAAGGPELPLLAALLYPGLALGYLLLVAAVAGAARAPRVRVVRPWLPALVGLALLASITVAVGPGTGRLVPLAWLVTGGVASIVLDLVLAGRSRRAGSRAATTLLLAHLAATVVLQALARPDDQSIALQWVQELLNTATQAAFLAAVTILGGAGRGAAPGRAVDPRGD